MFNSAAPDDGNMMVLEAVGTPAQKERWLQPIVDGEVRSAFAMTEPHPGGGSDPVDDPDPGREARRHATWCTAANGSSPAPRRRSHFILIARTSDDPRHGLTAFLFHKDQPGWRILRRIPIMGPEEHGGHCELEFDGLEIPPENVLLGEGQGLKVDADPARPRAADPLHALARPRQALRRDRAGLCGRARTASAAGSPTARACS